MTLPQFLMGLFVPAAWGLGFTLAKIGMAEFPPFMIMSLRFGIAAAISGHVTYNALLLLFAFLGSKLPEPALLWLSP